MPQAPNTLSKNEPSPHIEKLLEAANSASQTVAALHVAFLAFTAYLGVIVWGTNDEDLLLISPVKLPILDVDLPLTTFYSVVPWMVVLLHFNLLMQLELLSCKLWNLDRDLPPTAAGQQVRDRLFIFPFTHLIAGSSNARLIRWLLALVVGISVIALPLFMLLAAQIRFLPFHDEGITWSQRLAIWTDAAMLLSLWPLIASPRDKAREWWLHLGFRLLGYWLAWLYYFGNQISNQFNRLLNHTRREAALKPVLVPGTEPKGMIVLLTSVPLVVLLSIIAVVPGSITLQSYYAETTDTTQHTAAPHFEDWLIRHAPETWLSVAAHKYDTVSCTTLALAKLSEAPILQVMLGPCAWFDLGFFSRNLNLREARLVPKAVSLSLLTRATDPEKSVRDAAFKEFDGLNLQNRDLRFANLYGAILPKADLRHVQLQGAILLRAKLQGVIGWDKTQLQGAILGGTQLQGASLIEADLQGADLRGADLEGTDLRWTKLQSADLRGANLKATNIGGAKLQAANLRGAQLEGADLNAANLQAADLTFAQLQGTNMASAELQGAEMRASQLQGSDWTHANLEGVFIVDINQQPISENLQRKLEASLKPLLDEEKFIAFQKRMALTNKVLPIGIPSNLANCYSEETAVLKCHYQHASQLNDYRKLLHPKLIELACSDPAIAPGIASRAYQDIAPNSPNFGLADAMLKTLEASKPCVGLSSLSEQTRQRLQETATQQTSKVSLVPTDSVEMQSGRVAPLTARNAWEHGNM